MAVTIRQKPVDEFGDIGRVRTAQQIMLQSRICAHDVGLREDVECPAAGQQQPCVRVWLDSAGEPARRFSHTPRGDAHLPEFTSEQRQDAIRLADGLMAQYDGLGFIDRHGEPGHRGGVRRGATMIRRADGRTVRHAGRQGARARTAAGEAS
jgi:hypothetical protein